MKNSTIFKAFLCVVLAVWISNSTAQTNIAPQATVTASTCNTGPCSTLNDLNLGTCGTQSMWISTSGPPSTTPGVNWIEWNWSTPQSFDEIIIHHANGPVTSGRNLAGFLIQVWSGSTWVSGQTIAGLPRACINSVPITKITANRFRITSFTMFPQGQLSNPNFREIEIIEAPPNAPNDAGVSDIISPLSDCDGSNQDVEVELTNFGINQIFGTEVHWTINNIIQPVFNYVGILDTMNGLGSNTANVVIGNMNLVGGVTYDIVAWTELPNNAVDTVNVNDSSDVTIQGYNFPTVNLGNDTTTCPNDPITLNVGANRDSVSWNTSATTQTIVANLAQTYMVTVWKNGCSGGDTINVSFFPQPPPVNLGLDTMICYGDSILLDATTPGVTYLWHDNSTGPVYYADTIGNYSVIIEDANTCKSADDINVSLFAEPVVSLSVVPSNKICYGSPFEFRAASFTQGSSMYQWIINGVNSGAPTTNNKFSPTLNYGDSVAVQLLTDVCSSTTYAIETGYITMTINPEPRAISGSSEDTVLENTTRNYLVSLTPGSSFTWSCVGGKITTPLVGNAVSVDWGTAMDTAKIMVTERDVGNCSRTNVRNIVVKSIVGINDKDQHIRLGKAYPNPANTSITIPVFSNGHGDIDLSLYDLTGKKVKDIYKGNVSGNREFSFEVDDLDNGIYFYKIATGDGHKAVNKISIQH